MILNLSRFFFGNTNKNLEWHVCVDKIIFVTSIKIMETLLYCFMKEYISIYDMLHKTEFFPSHVSACIRFLLGTKVPSVFTRG